MEKIEQPIDLVLLWVDGNDPVWQAEKKEYTNKSSGDDRIIRYREWDNLQYFFRGVEKFLPWIRRVHFITYGHLPVWLNKSCTKLNIVNHKDYIPAEYLPTFSSHPIELNIHRIPELAEHFIYANDDMFFIRPIKKYEFFKNNLPVDCALETIHCIRDGGIDHITGNDLQVIDRNFNKRKIQKKYFSKWYNPKYGKQLLKSIYTAPMYVIAGFHNPHIPYPYLKSSFTEVWEKEFTVMDNTCRHRIRSIEDVNQWLIRYWQFASGKFIPGNPRLGKLLSIGRDDQLIREIIQSQKYGCVCLSDDDEELDFEKERDFLKEQFQMILPHKSSFEI